MFNNVVLLLDSTDTKEISNLNATGTLLPIFGTKQMMPSISQFWPNNIVSLYLCNSSQGMWQNRCLTTCLHHQLRTSSFHPLADGSLYMADDIFFNFTNAEKYPQDKIWYSEIKHLKSMNLREKAFEGEPWWWLNSLKPPIANETFRILDSLPDDLKNPYLRHINSTDGLIEGYASADWAYVPKTSALKLLTIMGWIEELAPTYFSEMGMPLAMNLAAPGDEKVYLNDYTMLWGSDRTNISRIQIYGMSGVSAIHPIKLSYFALISAWRDLLAHQYELFLRVSC
jgi:hypothetical protein